MRFNPRSIFPILAIGLVIGLALFMFIALRRSPQRDAMVWSFLTNPAENQKFAATALEVCANAPFLMPTDGLIGYIWDDSFRVGHRHQGLDIFGGTDIGITPVYAAYSGYLSRLSYWSSSVIIRIPSDPLNPSQQIWNYYAHMADPYGNSFIEPRFYPGIEEEYVEAGTLLGYQGNFSGDANNPVGVHLHFSVVKDDGYGTYLNELDIDNTLDPSPYFGMEMNANTNKKLIPVCDP